MDRDDPFAARGHDGLDELVVGVLVAAIDQLAKAEVTIGPFVVDAGKVQWSDRVVRRTDDVEAAKPSAGMFDSVRRFRRGYNALFAIIGLDAISTLFS